MDILDLATSVDVGWTLVAAALVFFMQAGFAMVETGFTRAKNAGNIIMKNLMDFSLGTPIFWVLGFGIMFGAAAMLDGLLDRMEQELGTPATVVATGGISKFVVPLCRRKLIYDRTLMLKGLNLLYQRNVRA